MLVLFSLQLSLVAKHYIRTRLRAECINFASNYDEISMRLVGADMFMFVSSVVKLVVVVFIDSLASWLSRFVSA